MLEFELNDEVSPWYVCPEKKEEFSKFQEIVRNVYSKEIVSVPIDNLPDDVELNEEF